MGKLDNSYDLINIYIYGQEKREREREKENQICRERELKDEEGKMEKG
jgi:hypothetical protein